MKEIQRYDSTVDILRIVSILAVIAIHTTTRTIEFSNFDLESIPLTLLFNQASRFAVPLFFMISGFVLELNYVTGQSYFGFLKKRIEKLFIPYLFWSAIYYFLVYPVGRNPFFIKSLLFGDASYQLYFIPSLLLFYFIFPILYKYFRIIGNNLFLLFLFLTQVAILYFDYYERSLLIPYPLLISILNFFPFVFGIYISIYYEKFKLLISKKSIVLLLFFLTLGSLSIIFKEGYFGYINTHNYQTFYSQWRPSVLIYSLSLSGLFYLFFNKLKANEKVVKSIAGKSFLVFLIHVIVLELISNFVPNLVRVDILYFGSVVLISFGFSYVLHKIPNLYKYIG